VYNYKEGTIMKYLHVLSCLFAAAQAVPLPTLTIDDN